jgi:hypothetical protein
MMKHLLCACLLALALTNALPVGARQKPPGTEPPPAEETLVNSEKQLWSLVKRRELKAFAELLADDYHEIFPEGDAHTKEQIIKFFETEFVLKDYSLSGFRVVMLNPDSGIVSFKAEVHGVHKGKDEKYRVACVSGWARRGGRWLNVFYQENYLKEPAAAL